MSENAASMGSPVLRSLQLAELEILKKVSTVCEQLGLSYCITGGTLLGAVRHGGFIPWDDDIDIIMPRKDYEIFIRKAPALLGDDLFLQCHLSDPRYWYCFARVRKNNTLFITAEEKNVDTHRGIFIDVFPLDYARRQKSLFQTIQATLSKALTAVIVRRCGLMRKHTSLPVKAAYILCKPFSVSQLVLLREKVMTAVKSEDALYYVSHGSYYSYILQTNRKDVFFPAIKLRFEDHEFCAPQQWDYFLSRIYGANYMELPPEDKRKTHGAIEVFLGE